MKQFVDRKRFNFNLKIISRSGFTFLFFLISFSNYAQSVHSFQWVKDIKSAGFDEAFDLVTDPAGNVFVCGQIEYDADFGNGVILESAGVHDIFVAKYNSDGHLIWAKRAGGKGGDKAQSIAFDPNGFIYLAGEYEDTCYWESIMKTTPGIGINNMFVAKYDTSGSVIWVRNISTTGPLHTRGYGVTCDQFGNVYACGGTKGDTYYGNTFLFTSAGDYDGTVVSFGPTGNFRWAKRMGGADSDKAYGIASDLNGSVYVTGYFVGPADFSPTVTLGGSGHTDIFLAKYNSSGILQWAKQAGDTGFDRAWDVTVNINGEIVITGEQTRGRFGSNFAHTNGLTDMFLAGYNSNGTSLWVTSGGGPEDDVGRGVAHDNAGNLYVAGDFGGSAVFPPTSISGNGYADVFLAAYDVAGANLLWVKSTGGLDNDRGRGVGTDPSGAVYFCGEYVDSARFDNIQLYGDTLLDIFVTKITLQNLCANTATASGQLNCFGACDGTATVNSTGQAPFTYDWSTSPVQSGATATGLCAGTYSVTVTDLSGCTSSATVVLNNPAQLLLTPGTNPITCSGICNGIANVTATGQSPFTYDWNSSPHQTGAAASGLCAGTYTVIVTDANGCTSTSSAELMDPAPLVVSSSTSPITCSGLCNGETNASATGEAPFLYNWNSVPAQSGETATALCPGLYTVTVTDNFGCTSTQSQTLTNPLPLQVFPSQQAISCSGACDGIANATASGESPFVFSWSVNPPQIGSAISGLCPGNYDLTVTDAAGCTSISSIVLTDPLPLQVSGTVNNTNCIGCSDGSIILQVGGGTGSYTFVWSTTAQTHDLQNISAGLYIVCVSDGNSCVLCDTFTVVDPTSGISSIDSDAGVSISPNPFTAFTTVQLLGKSLGQHKLILFSAIGESVFAGEFDGDTYQLDGSVFANGMYFLMVENKSGSARKIIPLIIER